MQLLKDQYNLFSLDSMDNHRMSMTKIFERYITQYIIDSEQKDPQKKKKSRDFNNIKVVQKIIAHLEEDILMIFKG